VAFSVSQSSVATQLKRGGKHDKCFSANFLLNTKAKGFLKSGNIGQRYERIISLVFFDSG